MALEFVPDRYKILFIVPRCCSDRYKVQEICERTVERWSYALQYFPDLFAIPKINMSLLRGVMAINNTRNGKKGRQRIVMCRMTPLVILGLVHVER